MKQTSTFKAVLLAASSVLLMSAPAGFADETGEFAQFSSSAEVSNYVVDYRPIQQFTKAFALEQRGRMKVSYAAVSQQGEAFMTQYKRYLSAVPVSSLSRDDQLAYWLNTRNMLVIDAMTSSSSRRRMSTQRGTPTEPGKMWTESRITVEGVEMSIQDIEQNIILANFSDNPNVIFGMYQGTSGGPAFNGTGFTGANIDAELEAVARDYVNSKNGLKISRKKAELPAIVGWYQNDVFGGDPELAKTHLAGLAETKTAAKLASTTTISGRKFSYSSDELVIRQQSGGGGNSFGGGGGGSFGGGGSGGGSFGGGGGS